MNEKIIFRTGQSYCTCDGKSHWINDIHGRRWKDGRCNCQPVDLAKMAESILFPKSKEGQ